MDPTMAFAVDRSEPPAIEVRVNFGIFAGRPATPAEIDRLAESLLDEVGEVSIIAEERHEIDANGEASVQLVRIEVSGDRIPGPGPARDEVERRILERAGRWARRCAADRQVGAAEGF